MENSSRDGNIRPPDLPLEKPICKLGSKASGGDGTPGDLFQILEDDAVKVLHSVCQQIGKTHQWHKTGKGQFSFQSQRKALPKNVQTTAQLHSSHTLAK